MSNVDLVNKVQADFIQDGRPTIKTGMEVEIYQKIKEGNKERVQRFKGVVIKTAGKSALEKTITVRRKVGAFGVERVFAVHSPTIEKIEILRQFKVRRKSIKFIRDLTGKAARLKEVPMKEIEYSKKPVKQEPKPVEEKVEASKTEKTAPVKEEVKTEAPIEKKETPKAEAKVEAPKAEAKPDDLTKVEGIGPKIAETLVAAGVATFADLSTKKAEEISTIIAEVKGSHTPDTWPEQAKMAADGKWDELKAWQDEMDGGKA